MALTRTTLAANMSDTALSFIATSVTGATIGGLAKIDNEYMTIVEMVGTLVKVRGRGDNGGMAVLHRALAGLTFGLQTDMPLAFGIGQEVPDPTAAEDFLSVSVNQVIPVPTRKTTYMINKASALASSTFANPAHSQDGLEVTFIGTTDFAHVVTTVDVNDGTTGSHTTLTSPAFAGGSLTLKAAGAKWMVKSNNLWVIT